MSLAGHSSVVIPILKGIATPSFEIEPESIHRRRNTDRKSTRLNSSHVEISYAVFCLKKKTTVENGVGTLLPKLLLFCFIAKHRPTLFFALFFFNDTATTEIYTLSLHDALPIFIRRHVASWSL